MPDFADHIRQAVARKSYFLSYHAIKRMAEKRVREEEIITTIERGEVLERHPNELPCPKCLFMYPVRPDEPLYVSCAYDEDKQEAIVITLHWMDPDKWIDERTRMR